MKSSQNAGVALLNVRRLAIAGVLGAITVVLGQFGGFIAIPGLPAKVTIMHIPVIIGAIIEGPVVGVLVGLLFGIFSMIQNMLVPVPLSFAFMNPLVSVLPRILIGITSFYAYKYVRLRADSIRIGVAAVVGTFTNSVGVLGMIYLLYAAPFAEVRNIDVSMVGRVIFGIAVTNGIPEAIAAVVIAIAVVIPIKKLIKK